ncbi:MAG: hypothetical protein GX542_10280 [Rhodococcus sp.]|nr:hypothetical protein [Rhodococcus sp. (in: high G+C Gram-positive bacteria)]
MTNFSPAAVAHAAIGVHAVHAAASAARLRSRRAAHKAAAPAAAILSVPHGSRVFDH